jgi:hypothetical protein
MSTPDPVRTGAGQTRRHLAKAASLVCVAVIDRAFRPVPAWAQPKPEEDRCRQPVAIVDPGQPMDILSEQAARNEEERDWQRTHCNCAASRRPPVTRDNAFRKPDEIPRQLPGAAPQPVEVDDSCCCCDCKNADDQQDIPKPAYVVTRVPCFLRGTRIRTTTGYRRIEDLRPGELLPSTFGGDQQIRRVRRTVLGRAPGARPWPEHAQPIRIAPSALADNVPSAALVLTAAHALLIDGWLISVDNLVNGTTIAPQEVVGDVLELFHIELEGHDVIDAEGAPCESLWVPSQQECAPRLGFAGRRREVASRLRSAAAPWFDRRQPLDIIRDRLEERATTAAVTHRRAILA